MENLKGVTIVPAQWIDEIDLHPPIWGKDGQDVHREWVYGEPLSLKVSLLKDQARSDEEQACVEQSVGCCDHLETKINRDPRSRLPLDIQCLKVWEDIIQGSCERLDHAGSMLFCDHLQVACEMADHINAEGECRAQDR